MNLNLNNLGILRTKDFTQKKRDMIMGIFTVGAILIVSFFSSDPVLDFLCRTVIFMLFATAVNIILGFGGLRPLGQATFFGFAAYAYVFLIVRAGLSVYLALPLALLLTVLLAAFLGVLTLRANDDLVFAFMNMGINILLWTTVQKMQIVGSDTGLTGATRLPFAMSTRANFYVCFVVCTVCVILIYYFFHSPFATTLKGTRENIQRMTFIGYNTRNTRLTAYMVSAFFCGIAGLLYSMRNMGAFPVMISSNTSMDGLIMCLVGGMGSFFGPILGAFIITFINVELPIVTQYYQAVLGVITCLCVLFLQGGIIRDKKVLDLEERSEKTPRREKADV